MGFFGKKEASHDGLLNKIANPNPNGAGLFGSVKNWGKSNGGLFGWLFNRNKGSQTQATSFQDNNDNNRNDSGGASW
jgi:hypothetical protein